MEKLSYSLLERQGYEGYLLKDAPERVLQFGEGAFLRAFAEDFIDQMNEKAGFNAKAVLVQPRGGHPDTCARFAEQDGLYTLLLRGREKGEAVSRKRIISCVSRCLDPKGDWQSVLDCAKNPDLRFIISNTTEAGIVFDPACKAEDASALCRELGYQDDLPDTAEVFASWIIEGPQSIKAELPFEKAGLPIRVVDDHVPYKQRKVRILNGAHTGFVLGAYLAGFDIVRDCMHNETIKGFMNKMLYDEVIPTLPLDKDDLMNFASAVQDRFNNPFVNHELMSISLNSTSKWRARNMPSFLGYIEKVGKLPPCLTMSLAAYIAFYSNDIQALTEAGLVCGRPKGGEYTVSDDRWVLEFYYEHRDSSPETLVHTVLANEKMWGQDLTQIAGLEPAVASGLKLIREQGAEAAYASCL